MTNYTFFIHRVSKFSFKFNGNSSTHWFSPAMVSGKTNCYQRTIHIVDQNSGRKRSCGSGGGRRCGAGGHPGGGGPPGDGGGRRPGGAGVVGQRSPNHPVSRE